MSNTTLPPPPELSSAAAPVIETLFTVDFPKPPGSAKNSDTVKSDGAQAHAATPAELDPLALIARHSTPKREQADPLLTPHVHRRAAAVVQDIRSQCRLPDRVCEVRDVRHRQLGLGREVVLSGRTADRVARCVVLQGILARVTPRDGGADVVDPHAQFDRARDPSDSYVAAHAVPKRVACL